MHDTVGRLVRTQVKSELLIFNRSRLNRLPFLKKTDKLITYDPDDPAVEILIETTAFFQ
jgi:hypothetical protein